MKKLYLCGPVSGRPDCNKAAFDDAAYNLRQQGFDVVNPLELGGDEVDPTFEQWASYLKRDLPIMMNCDAVAVLDGWQDSKGAKLEIHVAMELGIPIKCYDKGKLCGCDK